MEENKTHEHNHEHEHEEDTINLLLEDGTELKCIVLMTFQLDEKDYIALLPEGQEDVFLYTYNEIEGGLDLMNIEDDDEFDRVSVFFQEAFDEEDEEEGEE